MEPTADVRSILCVFPSLDVVQVSVPKLLDAVSSNNWVKAARALKGMGVLALCLSPERQFDRLEFIVGCVVGRARLIPLVELAIFAAEQLAYDRASEYVIEARTLGPGAPELHCILTVEGLIALNSGNTGDAKQLLIESIVNVRPTHLFDNGSLC
jgi:hypothetical protein